MANRTKRTPEKEAAFLDALREGATVTKACEVCKLRRPLVYAWRKADPEFARAWDEALDIGTDALEDEAIRRGKYGVEKPVYYQGQRIDTVTEYSDTLLMFMLKARRPEKFRERSEHRLSGDVTINVKSFVPKEPGSDAVD